MSGDTFENVNVVANKTIRQDVDDTTRPVEISGIKVGKTEYKHRATETLARAFIVLYRRLRLPSYFLGFLLSESAPLLSFINSLLVTSAFFTTSPTRWDSRVTTTHVKAPSAIINRIFHPRSFRSSSWRAVYPTRGCFFPLNDCMFEFLGKERSDFGTNNTRDLK